MIETSVFDKRLLTDLLSVVYLGYYYRQDLQTLVTELTVKSGTNVMNGLQQRKNIYPYNEINKLWEESNFNPNSMKWINYYPEKDFSNTLVNDVAFYLRLNGIHRAWISRLDPGYYAPLHWDVDDNEEEYLKFGSIKRYSIALSESNIGHIFIVGKDYIYNVPQGSIFKWLNHREWHVGINGGLKPKFTFHILGY